MEEATLDNMVEHHLSEGKIMHLEPFGPVADQALLQGEEDEEERDEGLARQPGGLHRAQSDVVLPAASGDAQGDHEGGLTTKRPKEQTGPPEGGLLHCRPVAGLDTGWSRAMVALNVVLVLKRAGA